MALPRDTGGSAGLRRDWTDLGFRTEAKEGSTREGTSVPFTTYRDLCFLAPEESNAEGVQPAPDGRESDSGGSVSVRILRINGWDGPTTGGAEVYVERVSVALSERGHPTTSVALVTEEPDEGRYPVRTYLLPSSPYRRAIAELLDRRALFEWLNHVARESAPDVLHLHHFRSGFSSLGPWIASRQEPVVFTAHDVELLCPIATLTLPNGSACPGGILPRCQFTGCDVGWGLPLRLTERRYFDRYVKRKVRSYICTSRATQLVFEKLGYHPTELLRPMIPIPAAMPAPPSGSFTIGFLGRFERQKGIDTLLQAFRMIRSQRPEVKLRFAGAGPYTIPRDPSIRVDGWVSPPTPWFAGVHVLVVPSIGWENLGNSAIEALAHGVPVIVSDCGGLPETVGEYGAVVPQGNAPALANALLELIRNYELERAKALKGREWVRRQFSTEHHLERLLAIYSQTTRSLN